MLRLLTWFRSEINTDFLVSMRKVSGVSLPIVVSYVSTNMAAFIGMVMIAKLGHDDLAAGALINSVMLAFMTPLWAFFYAVGALAGHQHGAKQHQEVGKIMRQSFIIAIIIGLPAMILLRNIGFVLILFGQNQHLSMLTQNFYKAYSWSVIPSLFDVCFAQFFISVGKQKMCLIFTSFTTFLLILFGYTFIYGNFGLPVFGIKGLGYAWIATNSIMMLVMFSTVFLSKTFYPYRLFESIKKSDFLYFKEIVKIGWPITAMTAGELIIFATSIIMFGWIGVIALAAQNIAMQLNIMAFMIAQGVGQAAMILVSQKLGAKQFGSVRNLGYASVIVGIIAAVLVLLTYSVSYKYLLGLYLGSTSIIGNPTAQLAVFLLMLAGLLNIFDFPRFIAVCTLRGLRDTVSPMLIFIGLGLILSLPASYFLAFVLHFGPPGIIFGFIIGYCVGSIILLRRFHRLADPIGLAERYSE